ncbi:DUF1992 domain-containing protein [Phytoactinopolyspora mesophila]|uniref:DUF1992 domain-containing protein n=1 Tax=Phytoactinopolyspora mesophila TaxID=2650750 RepID=A0A7K3M774_9ACTN|nr:DUF1992 domain-containing protein [Phytoactinopolyspora mesophila]NDL59030.1 DUF1992 domain-containing protein [Phytoactinopolyspora mesophila]
MTQRKPAGMGFESWIDRQIREAEERGEFDDLPGAGKPLTNLGRSNDEMWWIREKLEREGLSTDAVLPTPLKLRKEVDQLPEIVRGLPTEDDVRAAVEEVNERIKAYWRDPSSSMGPQVPVAPADVEKVVERWRAERAGSAGNQPEPVPEPSAPAQPKPRRRWWKRSGG